MIAQDHLERNTIIAYLTAFATRLRTGPRERESWETPINTNQPDAETAAYAAQLIEGLARGIEQELHHQSRIAAVEVKA